MFLDRKYQNFYQNYGNVLFEQGPAMISDDLNTRLKGYLQNDALISKLAETFQSYEDGKEYEVSNLDKKSFGIADEDRLFVKVDKEDKKAPKFFMWIMNEQFLWGDLNMDTAAAILKAGGEGTSWTEKGVIGSIGSFFGGNASGDAGTDEDTIASLAGAFAQIAAEKGVDPQIYFDKLDEIFKTKYGTTIKDFLETEFGGYGEVVSCNLYRRKIEPSVMRGLNPWSILGDIALTLGTFGIGPAFSASLKGAQVANAASKAVKAVRATKVVGTLEKGVKAIGEITRLSKLFSKLGKAEKIAALEKAGFAVGTEFKVGKDLAKIESITDDGVSFALKTGEKWGGGAKITHEEFLASKLTPTEATKVINAAGINLKPLGVLAAKKAGEAQLQTPQGAEEPGLAAKGAEALGYYDTMAADPNAYIQNAKQQGASDIASMLLDLKNGSGLFGNTTDQEECCIALLITGLTPEMAKEVAAEYGKIDAKMNVYSVLDDELGGDIGILAKAYWTGCTGEGDEYKPAIDGILKRIKTK